MKMILVLLFPLAFSMPAPLETNVHDFHLSRTRVEYAAQEQEWQISLHVFIDDLAQALEEKGAPSLRLGTRSESPEADAYLEKYLRQVLHFKVAGKPLNWEWLGKETSEDLSAFHVYLFIADADPTLPLTIKNQLLLDLYDDQQNMLQFIGPDKRSQQLLFHQDYWEAEMPSTNK